MNETTRKTNTDWTASSRVAENRLTISTYHPTITARKMAVGIRPFAIVRGRPGSQAGKSMTYSSRTITTGVTSEAAAAASAAVRRPFREANQTPPVAGPVVEVGQEQACAEKQGRQDKDGESGVEVQKHLLQACEVPGGLGRVRAQARVGRVAQGGVQAGREHEHGRDQHECDNRFAHQEVRHRQDPFGLCGGFLLFGTRQDEPACLPDPPEVKGHQGDDEKGKDGGVRGEEDAQRVRPDLGAAPDHVLQPGPDAGDVLQHADTDGGAPVGELVPRKEVAGEVRDEHQKEQTQPDDPVELARGMKGPGEEDPEQMKEDHQDEEVGAPMMDVADKGAEEDFVLQVGDGRIGLEPESVRRQT